MPQIRLFLLFFGILCLSHVEAEQEELIIEIISDILANQFSAADEKLLQLNWTSGNIEVIVASIYNKDPINFDVFIQYTRASSHIRIRHAILTALWNEIELNNHMNMIKLMVLYDTIKVYVINGAQEQTFKEIRAEAEAILTEIRNALIKAATKLLKTALINGNFKNNTNLRNQCQLIEEFEGKISDRVMEELIKEVYNQMDTDDLIRDMCSNRIKSQVITSLLFVNQKVAKTKFASGTSFMLIADCLKRLQENKSFAELPEGKINNVTYIINNIPATIRNLYFAGKVCIRNAHYSEYLYSPLESESLKMDSERRYVFSRIGGAYDNQSYWIVNKVEGSEFSFTFMSDLHRNELMYVPDLDYKNGNRKVATWIPGGALGKKSTWKFVPLGDSYFLFNEFFNDYLCLTDDRFSDYRRLVYTTNEKKYPSKCRWEIELCSGKN